MRAVIHKSGDRQPNLGKVIAESLILSIFAPRVLLSKQILI